MKVCRRTLAVAALVAAASLPVAAEAHDSGRSGPSTVLFQALQDELQRTLERLRLAGLARPYFVAYTVLESRSLELDASFGGLERPRERNTRRLQVEIRTGSREFDQTHFVGVANRNYRPVSASIPIEDGYDALRAAIWSLSDTAYKRAVEQLARKKVYRETRNIQEVLPDLSQDPVRSSRETVRVGAFDRPAWEQRARQISAVFREFPEVQASSAEVELRAQHLYFVDSEGRSYVKPAHRFEIEIEAEAQAADGMVQFDRRKLVFSALDQVPPLERLQEQARQLGRDVTALAAAPKVETYLGPVLLVEQAAGEFFSQLLGSGVAVPRELWVEQEWAEQYYRPGALTSRLGLRVISPIFDVVADPTLEVFDGRPLVGHYAVDEQGIPAERVPLVRRGILENVVMNRSPTRENPRSNGHGRGAFNAPALASIGNLIVTASKTQPRARMQKLLREEAEAFGLDYGMLITRVSREQDRQEDEILSAPVLVYRVDVASGERELVRDVQFAAVTMRALRDVIAASQESFVYNLAKPIPYASNATMRTSIVHPSVLLSEMELTETERKPTRPPFLEHPYFTSPANGSGNLAGQDP